MGVSVRVRVRQSVAERLETVDDKSSGCESSSETEVIFRGVKTQVQSFGENSVIVHTICVRRDPDFKKAVHDAKKDSWIVRSKGGILLQSKSIKNICQRRRT